MAGADESTICGVCGQDLEGPWVSFHWALPHKDADNPGHYVDGGTRDLQEPVRGPESDEEGGGMAPSPPPRQKGFDVIKAALEGDVRWDTISFLRMVGYLAYNMEQGHRPGAGHTRVGKGVPDVYFQGHGATGWIEFKRPDGKPAREKQTAEQKAFERAELANGGIYLLVESTRQVEQWDREHRGRQLELEED